MYNRKTHIVSFHSFPVLPLVLGLFPSWPDTTGAYCMSQMELKQTQSLIRVADICVFVFVCVYITYTCALVSASLVTSGD